MDYKGRKMKQIKANKIILLKEKTEKVQRKKVQTKTNICLDVAD